MFKKPLAVAAVLSILVASTASARAPEQTRDEFSFPTVNTSWCGFPILLTSTGSFTETVFFDREGNPVRYRLHSTDVTTATNPATGATLTGRQVVNVAESPESATRTGVPIHFNRPGGTTLIEAGRIFFDPNTGDVEFRGKHQVSEGDFAAFCAALQ